VDRGAHLSGGFDYSADDQARWVVEEPKRDQAPDDLEARRGQFQRDRARVLHSYAFRRLADKTQVVSPGQGDFPRTRLTHSLEVAQIAREIGAGLGCDPDVTDTAGLAHDLGHPPFGHNGEEALNQVSADIGGFEGNAQTLRILSRLEAKVIGPSGESAGLNLTRASLDAVCKYPWPARPDTAKFGTYRSDLAVFEWLRHSRPDGIRCLEAQVMDWADDVAYSVHDVEDGVHSGHIRFAGLTDEECVSLLDDAARVYSDLSPTELGPHLERLLALPALRDLASFDGSFRSQADAKRATSELTGRLAGSAVVATHAKYGDVPLGRYEADLIVPAATVAECALLKAIAYRYVMQRPGVDELLASQRRIVIELVEALAAAGVGELSAPMQSAWQAAADDGQRFRVVIDQVSQLTDSAAVDWHRRLVGGHQGPDIDSLHG